MTRRPSSRPCSRRQRAQDRLLSSEHFTVDGTLLETWASLKSFRPKPETWAAPQRKPRDQSPTAQVVAGAAAKRRKSTFRGQKRTNQTHASTTDPEARLMRKGKGDNGPAKLCLTQGTRLMENRQRPGGRCAGDQRGAR